MFVRRAVAGLILAALPMPACFIGYDSRWGEAKRAQARAAAQATPASIGSSSGGTPEVDADVRTLRVRFLASPAYLTQTIDAPHQIGDLLEDANRVLVPRVGLRLELDRLDRWAQADDEDLGRCLDALRAEDRTHGADLLVGMVGALPRPSDSFHEVGRANLLDRYVVVRASGRLTEDRSIDSAFDQLGEDERLRLLRARKRHRALAVLLHEIGHALGAPHDSAQGSVMNAAYAPTASDFTEDAVRLMRVAATEPDRMAAARAQLRILEETTPSPWPPAERSDEIAYLRALVVPASRAREPRAGAKTAPSPSDDDGLPTEAVERLGQADEMMRSGAIALAYETVKPLFFAYPDDRHVQDVRCQLATLRFLARDDLVAECAPYARLSLDAGK